MEKINKKMQTFNYEPLTNNDADDFYRNDGTFAA